MRTKISVPDDLFRRAEDLARRMNISRSELYSRALSDYLDCYVPDRITDAMNRTIIEIGESTDPFVSVAAQRILSRTEW